MTQAQQTQLVLMIVASVVAALLTDWIRKHFFQDNNA